MLNRGAQRLASRPLHSRQLLRICGFAAVGALFARDPARVERLFFEGGLRREVAPFCRVLARARKPYRQVDAEELARISGTALHGGIAAIAAPQPVLAFERVLAQRWARDGKPLLVLDGIGNPHNLGAIARSVAFFGLEHLLLGDGPEQALPSDASYRVAEGGLEYLQLHRAALPTTFSDLRPDYRVVGTAPEHGTPLDKLARQHPVALVLGNEEAGLSPATIAACDELVTIPGSDRMQSLNVAAAAAVMLYALTRP